MQNKYIKSVIVYVSIAIFLDLFILMFILMSIMSGEDVVHIPFWDKQIMFIVSLLK